MPELKSSTKKAAPGCRAPRSRGNPALPDSMRRLRNSTWRGAHNAPHCGTDSVSGGRKLGRNPSHGHLYRRRQSESSRLFPQTELRLTCHRCTVLVDYPTSSRAARRTTWGPKPSNTAFPLSPESRSPATALALNGSQVHPIGRAVRTSAGILRCED